MRLSAMPRSIVRLFIVMFVLVVALPVVWLGLRRGEERPASRMLSGLTVLIDPGHGGRDQGAVGRNGVQEEPVVLSVGMHLRTLLQSDGATVLLTRETDTDLAGEGEGRRKPRDMKRRVEIGVEWKADLVVSIHANAVPSTRWTGAQVFYNHEGHPDAKRLAQSIQAELVRLVGGTARQASSKIEHYILHEAKVPAVTVEVGFLSNPTEERKLADPEYQKSLAWAIFNGITRFVAESRER